MTQVRLLKPIFCKMKFFRTTLLQTCISYVLLAHEVDTIQDRIGRPGAQLSAKERLGNLNTVDQFTLGYNNVKDRLGNFFPNETIQNDNAIMPSDVNKR